MFGARRLCGLTALACLASVSRASAQAPDAGALSPAPKAQKPTVASPAPPLPTFDAQLAGTVVERDGSVALVGRSGQLYLPSADNTWERAMGGSVAVTVSRLVRASSGKLFAIGDRAPLFARSPDGLWARYALVSKGSAAASPDSAAIIAIRRQLYELGATGWKSFAKAPAQVALLWAGASRQFYVADAENHLWFGRGSGWQSISLTLRPGESLTELRGLPKALAVARTSEGRLFALGKKSASLITAPSLGSDVFVEAVGHAKGQLWAVARHGEEHSLVAVGERELVRKEPLWTPSPGDHFSLIAGTKDGVVVATARGQVRILSASGTWTDGTVKLPNAPVPAFPNSGPARAR